MLKTLVNAWKVADIRKKIIYTVLMLLVFRLGSHIPVPGIDPNQIKNILGQGTLFGFFDIISGGAFRDFTIFAMSIVPYINASIIMQLLTIAIPSLEQMAKEGEEGRKKIAQYTRYMTVVLALIQAIGMTIGLRGAVINPTFLNLTIIVLTLTAGTSFLMWLGERITENGVGNGSSLIIFAGILARIPNMIYTTIQYVGAGTANIFGAIAFLIVILVMIVSIILMSEGQRRIPVQYAKRVVGRKVYGGQSTHIPLRINMAGVIPLIFALSLLQFPQQIATFFPKSAFYAFTEKWLGTNGWIYNVLNVLLIIFFTYFYTAIIFNPVEISDNMKKYGGFIPGIRPGKPTTDFITRVMNRVTFVGSIFLAVVAVLPVIMMNVTGLQLYFGGTALLIAVGVALETMKQIEGQLIMRNYQGFLR
ncbi:preprotein translocase subunit SecY [Thermoanaerobacterium thermosaccharolyticum]|uniref:preprotein translocase subunit SecY n=1 Tax=Thermoanaerobacterium thermosaccharolyticum TaxID=1517 RepID=UPI003DA9BFB4